MGKTAVPEAIAEQAIDHAGHRECKTCHKTVDIPTELYMRLDAGIFQNGREVTQIDLNEDWYVGAFWCLLGRFAGCVCVDWCVSVKFESMGEGEEFSTSDTIIAKPCDYCWKLHISSDKIIVKPGECADVYRVVVVVTAREKKECGGRPVGITGFCNLGLIEFYTGKTGT